MDRVKRISYEILELHKDSFTVDFEKNKEILAMVAVIRSKQLRNEVAGFITKLVRSRSMGGEKALEEVGPEGEPTLKVPA